MLHKQIRLLVAALVTTGAPHVHAQTSDHRSSAPDLAGDHESVHESHKNVVSFFAGVTHAGRRENSAALGFAYERLLNNSFGIGALAEHTFGDADFTVYAIPFAYRVDEWKFSVAPGIEDSKEHGTKPLLRLATEYAFKASSWEISPQFAVDFVDGGQELILGVAFGKAF